MNAKESSFICYTKLYMTCSCSTLHIDILTHVLLGDKSSIYWIHTDKDSLEVHNYFMQAPLIYSNIHTLLEKMFTMVQTISTTIPTNVSVRMTLSCHLGSLKQGLEQQLQLLLQQPGSFGVIGTAHIDQRVDNGSRVRLAIFYFFCYCQQITCKDQSWPCVSLFLESRTFPACGSLPKPSLLRTTSSFKNRCKWIHIWCYAEYFRQQDNESIYHQENTWGAYFTSITSQLTMHMSRQHRWFDMLSLPWPHLVGKASLYLLPLFPFHTVTPLFLYLRSVPTGNQVLGSGLRSSFRPRLLFFFLLFQSLELCLSSSAREKRKRMREGLAHESKGLDIREKGRGTAKGHREGDSAVGCHGYWKAAD